MHALEDANENADVVAIDIMTGVHVGEGRQWVRRTLSIR